MLARTCTVRTFSDAVHEPKRGKRKNYLEIQTASGMVLSTKEAKVYIQELGTFLLLRLGSKPTHENKEKTQTNER